MMAKAILYSRQGCHLCDDARAVLESEAIAFDEVDITGDPGLEAEYGILVPVVEVAGQPVFEAGMNPTELPDLVKEA
ncbi:MAG: glutaredoxin family protein [Actinomycetota bacterium]